MAKGRRGTRRLECAFSVLEGHPELRPAALRSARTQERKAAVREAEQLLVETAGERRIFRTEAGYEIWDGEPAGMELFIARIEAGVPLSSAVRIIGGWKE